MPITIRLARADSPCPPDRGAWPESVRVAGAAQPTISTRSMRPVRITVPDFRRIIFISGSPLRLPVPRLDSAQGVVLPTAARPHQAPAVRDYIVPVVEREV